MDQNFNDMSTYDDSIENFIKDFNDIQKNKEPIVFLVYYPQLHKYPHPGTRASKMKFNS